MVKLSDHDLKQMDATWIEAQPTQTLRSLCIRLADDLRNARDRLNQNPGNSSRPSGSMPPWERTGIAQAIDSQGGSQDEEVPIGAASRGKPDGNAEAGDRAADVDSSSAPAAKALAPEPDAPASHNAPTRKKSGRRPGAIGYGRTQQLTPTRTEYKHPSHCAACQRPFVFPLMPAAAGVAAGVRAWTGWDSLELEPLSSPADEVQILGLRIQVTRHLLMAHDCACGHNTRAQPHRSADDESWPGVELGEQRLLGPRLAAAIVYLSVRLRLPRRKVQELLRDLFGLELSTAVIDQAVQQTARSVEPLEQEIHQALQQATLVHADETSWLEAGASLWLWVLACSHSVLYFIGTRAKEMLRHALDLDFAGTLMSDGYVAYRARCRRLRCWAHLLRKLQGLVESCDASAAQAGSAMLELFKALMQAVYTARLQRLAWQALREAQSIASSQAPGPPHPRPPCETHGQQVQELRQLCEQHSHARHPVLGAVAREFLNDWEAIMAILAQPHLPLTNNAAERQLRHWVIARRISYGTRTKTASNGLAMLASVIDTCRLRGASIIETLADAIHAARRGLPAPAMPPVPALLIEQDRSLAQAWGGV